MSAASIAGVDDYPNFKHRRKQMFLKVVRKTFSESSTIGELTVDGKFECYTLEDKVRAIGIKIKGSTAIPEGIYEVIVNYSQKFKQYMPLLLKVPNFDGIRIHSGNTSADTTGCILVGRGKGNDKVTQSRLAYNALFPKIEAASKREKIHIEIVGGNEDDVALGRVSTTLRAARTASPAKKARSKSRSKRKVR